MNNNHEYKIDGNNIVLEGVTVTTLGKYKPGIKYIVYRFFDEMRVAVEYKAIDGSYIVPDFSYTRKLCDDYEYIFYSIDLIELCIYKLYINNIEK